MLAWYRALRYPLRMGGRVGAAEAPRVLPPTPLLRGRRDRALGAELARPTLARCADGRLVFIDQVTHWLQHEEPERVNAALIEYLS